MTPPQSVGARRQKNLLLQPRAGVLAWNSVAGDPRPGTRLVVAWLGSRFRPLLQLKTLLQILAGFVHRALGVVVGLQGLAIFIGGAFALAGHIKYLAQLDVAPNFCPAGVAVTIQAFAISVSLGLIVFLLEKYFSDAIVRERTILVVLERFVEFEQGTGQISLLG